jgi:hypothetical protein
MLYAAGRIFSQAQGTLDYEKIEQHLGTRFDCPISTMCRNINWRAPDLNNIKGIYELFAFLDRPLDETVVHLTDTFKDAGIINQRDIYEIYEEVKESVVTRLEEVEARVGVLEGPGIHWNCTSVRLTNAWIVWNCTRVRLANAWTS